MARDPINSNLFEVQGDRHMNKEKISLNRAKLLGFRLITMAGHRTSIMNSKIGGGKKITGDNPSRLHTVKIPGVMAAKIGNGKRI